MKFFKLFLNKKFLVIFCIVLSALICVVSTMSIMIPSYVSYKKYYDKAVEEREYQKYLQSLPLEFLGISAEVKDTVTYYDNGRAYPTADDFSVTAHFTEKGRDFDEKLRSGTYEITVPDGFAANGGTVRVSYTFTSDNEGAEPVTKTADVPITLVPVKLESLSITAMPYRVAYKAGMTFDTEGMSATAEYNDGTTVALTASDIKSESAGALTAGTESAKVSYSDGKTTIDASVPISVKSEAEYTDGEILSVASDEKCYVSEGALLTDAKPVVRATYSNGNRLLIDESEYTVTGNIETATFMKNCILTISLKDDPSISHRTPVGVRNGIEAESANVTGSESATNTVEGYVYENGEYVAVGTSAVVEKAEKISFVIDSVGIAKTGLSLRLANRSKDEDGNIAAVKLSDILGIKVNGRLVPVYASSVLGGYSANSVEGYVFEDVKLPDIALNRGENTVELSFVSAAADGVTPALAVDRIDLSTMFEGKIYNDFNDCLLSGLESGTASEVKLEKIKDFHSDLGGSYGHAMCNDGRYIYVTYTGWSSGLRGITVAKYDPESGEVVCKSAKTDALFAEATAGITYYDGKIILFCADGTQVFTDAASFNEGCTFAPYDGFAFEGLEEYIIRDVYYNSALDKFAVFYSTNNTGEWTANAAIFDGDMKLVSELALSGDATANPVRLSGGTEFVYINYSKDGIYTPKLYMFDWNGGALGSIIIPNTVAVMGGSSVITHPNSTNTQGMTELNGELYFTILKFGSNLGGDQTMYLRASYPEIPEDRELILNFGENIVANTDRGSSPEFDVQPATGSYGAIEGITKGSTMGGVSDGKYLYVSLNPGDNTKTVVYKIDAETYAVVAQSAIIPTGAPAVWAGDNSQLFIKGDTLYCVIFDNKILSVKLDSFVNNCTFTDSTGLPFDAAFAAMTERETTVKGVYWSEAVARYVLVDKANGMYILDESGDILGEMVSLKTYSGMKVTSVTGDDKYIYVAYSANNQKSVPFDIYTWDGTYVGTGAPEGVHLREDIDDEGSDQPYNIQAIFFHEGEMFATFCSWTGSGYSGETGAYLWKMKALNDPLTKPYLESIEVTGELVKKEYIAGEKFDPTGLVVTAYYSDGSSAIIDNADCVFSPQSLVNQGEQTVTISYTEGINTFTDTVTVTVLAPTALGDYLKQCETDSVEPEFNVAPSKGTNGLAIANGVGYTMGGVSDGEYIYISQNKGGNANTQILKIDPDTYEVVATSAMFETGIGEESKDNSRLFIKDGKLYCVVTGRVVRSIELSAFTDGCSLDIDETLPFNNVSGDLIDAEYNGTLQKYAVLSAQTLSLLDGEGNLVKQIMLSGNKPSEQASQNPSSIASDDKYIYVSHKLNDQNDVLILVYDWEGNFVGSCAPSGIRLTSEGYNTQSIFIHNGVVYATLCTWTNTAGVYVWTISFSA